MPASQPQTPHGEQAAIPQAANPVRAPGRLRQQPLAVTCRRVRCGRANLDSGWPSGRPMSAADRAAATVADGCPPRPGWSPAQRSLDGGYRGWTAPVS